MRGVRLHTPQSKFDELERRIFDLERRLRVQSSDTRPESQPADDWTIYDVSWITQGAGADPAIGNGQMDGAYVRLGKTIHFRIHVQFGSTTTYGSGPWEFSIPVAADVAYLANDAVSLAGYAENLGIVGYSIASGRFADTGYFLVHSGTTGNAFNATTPFTWGTSDFITMSGFYESHGHPF